jgi:hypothetical protein
MSSLLEKLAERTKIVELEKTAEQIFADAFIDELVKLGYDEELLKKAGIGDFAKNIGGKLTGLFSKGTKTIATNAVKTNPAWLTNYAKANAARAAALPKPGLKQPWDPDTIKVNRRIDAARQRID